MKATPEGVHSLIALSQGDMRRALNILQVCVGGGGGGGGGRGQHSQYSRFTCTHTCTHNMLDHMQSTSMACDTVDENSVYACTGQPLPSDIANIVHWMLNDSFSTAYQS